MATTTKSRTPNGTRNSATSKTAKPNGTASATKAKAPTVEVLRNQDSRHKPEAIAPRPIDKIGSTPPSDPEFDTPMPQLERSAQSVLSNPGTAA